MNAAVRLTSENANRYVGYDIAFHTRGIRIVKKLLSVSDTGKTAYIDHQDLNNNIVIEKRVIIVVEPV